MFWSEEANSNKESSQQVAGYKDEAVVSGSASVSGYTDSGDREGEKVISGREIAI